MSAVAAQSATAGQAMSPRYIRIDEADNVAIVVNDFGLAKGTRFACGLQLREHVPQGHKVALVDIARAHRCGATTSSSVTPTRRSAPAAG